MRLGDVCPPAHVTGCFEKMKTGEGLHMVIRNRLHRILFEKRVHGREFAELCELDQSHLNRIKNGHAMPSVGTAIRIATALGLEVEDVFAPRVAAKRAAARAAAGMAGERQRRVGT
jgi:transcriptional regulator with XRE-family HTH domain